MRINLTDNNNSNEGAFPRNDVAALFPMAKKTVAELCRENENLLIFPYSIDESDDRIGDATVMEIESTSDPDKVHVKTGNVMGSLAWAICKSR